MKVRTRKLVSILCALALVIGLVPMTVSAAATPQTWTWADKGTFFTSTGKVKGRDMSYNGVTYTEGLKLQGSASITFTIPDGEAGTLTMVFANTSTNKEQSNFQLDGTAIPMEPQKTSMQVYTNKTLKPGKHTITPGQKEATVYYLEWAVAHSHVWVAGEVTKQPTCTEAGEQVFRCTAENCPTPTKTEPVAPKGHTPKQVPAVPATCVVDGKTAELVCAVCNAHISGGVVIPATGSHTPNADGTECTVCHKELPKAHTHVFDGDVVRVIRAATCTTAGSQVVQCSVDKCDAVETQTVEPLGHKLVHHAAVEPACGANGHAAYDTCERCDYTTFKVTPHTPGADGTCTECGEVVAQPLTNAGGWFETLYAVLPGMKDADVTAVSYEGAMKGSLRGDDFKYLVRDTADGVRVDIPGLTAGTYSLSITAKGTTYKAENIEVMEHDRSGYAHFKYDKGVGAYRDDGVLKDDAIVLYVTNENKNTVEVESSDGTRVVGIGHILNSAGRDRGNGKCGDPTDTSKQGTPNNNQGIMQKLADDKTPVVVRIIGAVQDPDGTTKYDSPDYGGTVGDNGAMARIAAAHNVTIEGIGPDAVMDGWGIHFMRGSSDNGTERGTSFEVRNIKFQNVPEDCIGLEGTGNNMQTPVERGWVHNCSFFAPSISNPAESDKAGGDGACDFKRGQYFTMDYCYYEDYHKTNLVGASDSNEQYNITWHHNYWKNCDSRGPLGRQANMHIYNCYYEGNISKTMDVRANCYIFSEYNTLKNCKNAVTIKTGAVKSYKDAVSGTTGDYSATVVTDKSQKVDSNCKKANFDTDASMSYIPAGDYKLDNSVTKARQNIMAYAGPMKAQIIKAEDVETDVVVKDRVPQNAVVLPYDQAMNKAYIASTGEKDNIRFDLSGADASFLKIGRTAIGQDIIFKVNEPVDISIEDGGGTGKATLGNASGETLITGTGTASNLPAGVYFVQSSMIDSSKGTFKEAKLAHLKITKTTATEPPHEHSYTGWKQTVAPTCTKVGTEIGTCSCGETDRRDVDKIAHRYNSSGVCEMCGVLEGTFSGGNQGPEIPVTGLIVSPAEVDILQNQTQQMTYTIMPSDATDRLVDWVSDNTAIATVTRRGEIKGVGPGTCTVTATAGGITQRVTVNVTGVKTETFTFSANAEGPNPVPSNPGPALAEGSKWGTPQKYFTNVGADKNTWTAKNFTGKQPDKTPGSVLLATQQGGAMSFTIDDNVVYAEVELNASSTGSDNKSAIAILKGSSLASATFVPDAEGDRLTVCTGTATTNVKYTLTPGTYFIVAPAGVLASEVDENWDDFVTDANNPNKRGVRLHRVAVIESRVSSGTWVPAESVSLNETSLTVEAGMRATLLATVLPEDTTNKTVTWTSSDPTVASVDRGTVYGWKAGTATITASCGGQMATCAVTVTGSTREPVLVTSITVSGPTAVQLDGVKDQEVQLTRVVLPEEADNREVEWSSNTPGVTVDSRGLVTIAAETPSGTVTITATAKDGSGVKGTHTITVKAPAEVVINGVKILKGGTETYEETVKMGESLTLTAQVDAQGLNGATVTAADRAVTWSSSDTTVATVDDQGVVTPVKAGTATITATSVKNSDVYEDLELTVEKGDVTLTIDARNPELLFTGGYSLVSVKPAAVNATVTASAGATVEPTTEDGYNWKVTVPANATAEAVEYTITAAFAGDDSWNAAASVTATIKVQPEGVKVIRVTKRPGGSEAKVAVTEGDALTLTVEATVQPEGELTYVWSKDGVVIEGASSATYTKTAALADAGEYTYTLKADGAADHVGKVTVEVAKKDAPTPPTPSGGGSGGFTSNTKTETLADGTKVTTTETANGAKKENIVRPDGTKAEMTYNADGSASGTVTMKDGTKAAVTTNQDGETTAKVTVPAGVDGSSVTIPAENVKPGTVAVIVKDDGTEELIRMSAVDEVGLKLRLDDSATVKLADKAVDFVDMPGHWAEEKVDFVSARALFNGTDATHFSPNATMTRGMMATVLFRLNGERKGSVAESFKDVADGIWYTDGVAWAAETGVVTGYSADTFAPDDNVTREQLAVMIYRYAKSLGLVKADKADTLAYADAASVNGWATEAVSWLTANGILTGKPGNLVDPQGNASRAEVATVLERFVELAVQ